MDGRSEALGLMNIVARKEVYVPTVCGVFVACVSLIFYAALVHVSSTNVVATFISTTSLAAIVQIAFVPQAWIYVFSSHDPAECGRRLSSSAIVEIVGGLAGLLVILPLVFLTEHGWSLLLAYAALALAGSTGAQGYVRGRGMWGVYVVCVTLPSLLRLAIAGWAVLNDSTFSDNLLQMVVVYLLIPEVIRYITFNVYLTWHAWQPVSRVQVRQTLRHLFRNWLYDIGSGTTEVADKYLIGLIVSPSLLLIYFFVRKLSAAVTIVLEPIYSSRFRALNEISEEMQRSRERTLTLRNGYGISVVMCFTIIVAISALSFAAVEDFYVVPKVISDNMEIFIACLLIDGAIAANRWGRYISILDGRAVSFLFVRLMCFSLFIALAYVLTPLFGEIALCIGFLSYALVELIYVVRSARRVKGFYV